MQGKILHIMNYAASYPGNFMASLESLDELLKQDGCKNIYLFTGEAKENGAMSWISKLIEGGEHVEFLSGKRSEDASLIKRLVKEEGVIAIHTHFITMQQYLAVYQATLFSKIPVLMHMHNHSREAKNPVKNFLRRFLYGKCTMIACSESVFHSLERDYPANDKYAVDNGVNFARLDSYEKLSNSDFGFDEEDKVCLIFGFDYYRKGVDLAVEAINRLRMQGKKYSLLISLSTNFEEVETNIKSALGKLPDWVRIIKARNDVATLYNYVDLFLSPSREEGLPYSVVEAGYSKCSVVMSDISAQKYLKIPYGTWFSSEDAQELAGAIEKAMAEHAAKLNHWEDVQRQMKENYALAAWSRSMYDLYGKLIR